MEDAADCTTVVFFVGAASSRDHFNFIVAGSRSSEVCFPEQEFASRHRGKSSFFTQPDKPASQDGHSLSC
jgi:hypothetical protein